MKKQRGVLNPEYQIQQGCAADKSGRMKKSTISMAKIYHPRKYAKIHNHKL